ncbi:MAG: bifunctional shikimate kinase/3-dehydroquinate synthase [Actinomycetota bacterium]|nr:bifunctional shikimate kinase/3-dehydroquinate synthase [Actinomycetota bacterium]
MSPPGALRRPGGHVVLVGMPGSGKTTLGAALARRLGRPFLDTDAEIERRSEMSVRALFEREGEPAFRARERDLIAEVTAEVRPMVIAVGGGAVVDGDSRARLARAGQVLWLRARPETLSGRLGKAADRPLLAADPNGTLERLAAEREAVYREASAGRLVDVDAATPDEAVEAALSALLERVRVEVPGRSYEVVIGPGARRELAAHLPAGARRCAVVTQAGIDLDIDTGIPTTRVEIAVGERHKSLASVEACCRAFVAAGLTRSDVVIGLGGGMVTDVAGFAAASYHRGVAVLHVATTLLAQVDAAIGGKTGVNLPEGKNLVGAFWQPEAVLCDTDALASLPEREWRSGLGEIAKCAFLGVAGLEQAPLVEQVAACVAKKAEVVGADERESARRVILNYGHTLAHALEAAGLAESASGAPGELRHGEAVAIGVVFAARLSERLGRIDAARVAEHRRVLEAYGLETTLPPGADLDELVAAMYRDKKATNGLTFVLDGPGGVEAVAGVDEQVVREVLGACLAEAAGTPVRR